MVLGSVKILPVEDKASLLEAGDDSALEQLRVLRSGTLGHRDEAASAPSASKGSRTAFSEPPGSARGETQHGSALSSFQIRSGSGNLAASTSGQDVISRVKSATQLRKASMVMGSRPGETATRNGALASCFPAPHPVPGRGLCFSPDGQLLLRFGYSPELRIMNANDGKLARTLRGSTGNIRFASFSKDGRHILTSTDDCHVHIYKVESLLKGVTTPEADIDVGDEPVAFCLLSPDASVVLSCDDDGQLETWSVEDERMLNRYETGHLSVLVSFTVDGKHIISCANYECGVVVVDVSTGEQTAAETFDQLQEGRNKPAYSLAPDGSKAILYIKEQTSGSNVAVYDVASQSYTAIRACDGAVLHVDFSSMGTEFLVAGRDNMIHVYDSDSLDIIGILASHTTDVLYCRVSGDQQHAISGDSDGNVFTWNIGTCQPLLQLQAHKAPVVSCDISRNGARAYTLDSEGTAHLWYLDQQGIFDILQQYSDLLSCCQLAANGKMCAVGYSDGAVRLFTVGVESSMVWQHAEHITPVGCLAFNGGCVASGSRDGMLVVTSASSGSVLVALEAHSDAVTWLSYNADGTKLLSSARDGTLCLWQGSPEQWSNTGPARTFAFQGSGISSVTQCALDPRGAVAAACCLSGSVSLWDTSTGCLTHSIRVADVETTTLSFSDDSRFVLVGSADGSTLLLEADTGKQLRSIVGNASSIVSVYFEGNNHATKQASELTAVSVCSRQAVTIEMAGSSSVSQVADFLSDPNQVFRNTVMEDRELVAAYEGILLYDPLLRAAVYDMRKYEQNPGNSALFREGTAVMVGGVHRSHLVLYSPPDKTVAMLSNETGGVKSLDFSPDGKLVVSGNIRGELSVWDMVHRQQIRSWMAHKRSSITCVKFSQDSKQVYSCGEDTKVILWDWRTGKEMGKLVGHQSPVVSVEMSLNGARMVSGDKDGVVIIWDTELQDAMHVVAAHDGPILCCSICPDGSKVISSGKDEHICIIDCSTGQELFNLDDSLDGMGLTVKFSFDGTRVQIGGDKGQILIWDMERNCLLYDIDAHTGSVYDCSWSGDSRRLLSVGTDGRARLWDAAAGSELCQANFEHGFGVVDSGGFVKCDLSAGGTTMAGCTAKGHLIQWDIGLELRKSPNGQMLYKCLASMPVSKAKTIYNKILQTTPLLFNAQDSRGWTVLMHAAANSNPEIIKLIVGSIQPNRGCLGLMASPLQQLAGFSQGADGDGSGRHVVEDDQDDTSVTSMKTPNAINIAIRANNADCVNHLLKAVLHSKVTPGSYRAVTDALSEVASQYPTMCEVFLSGLPLRVLGEMEIPSSVASQGIDVKAATSYTSYKELWQEALNLDAVPKGPMVVMEAVMVQLPFCASIGSGSILDTLVESKVPVKIFGSDTVRAIIDYKWNKFASSKTWFKAILYFAFVILFTVYSVVLSDDLGPARTYWMGSTSSNSSVPGAPGTNFTCNVASDGSFSCQGTDGDPGISASNTTLSAGVDFIGLISYAGGRTEVAFSLIIFFFGTYFMALEAVQLLKLGARAYFDSFWNLIDIVSYAVAMVLPPCVLARYGMEDGGPMYPLVALECVLLWTKLMFFGLAVDGLGTFIYMLIEILKGLKWFYVLLVALYVSFGTAFMNLFRLPADPTVTPADDATNLFNQYANIQRALLSSFLVTFGFEDARQAYLTMWPVLSIMMLCLYNFLLIVILLNMLITLMGDLYKDIKAQQGVVFLRNRAELIMEVESTMSAIDLAMYQRPPPYLHLLRPLNLEDKRAGDGAAESSSRGGGDDKAPADTVGAGPSELPRQLSNKESADWKSIATLRTSGRHSGSRDVSGVASRREVVRTLSRSSSRTETNIHGSAEHAKDRPSHRISMVSGRVGGRTSNPGATEFIAGLGGSSNVVLEKVLVEMSRDMAVMRRTIESLSQQQARGGSGMPLPISKPGSKSDSVSTVDGAAARHSSGLSSRARRSPSPVLLPELPRSSGMGALQRSIMPLPASLPTSPPSDASPALADRKSNDILVLSQRRFDDRPVPNSGLTQSLQQIVESPRGLPASSTPSKGTAQAGTSASQVQGPTVQAAGPAEASPPRGAPPADVPQQLQPQRMPHPEMPVGAAPALDGQEDEEEDEDESHPSLPPPGRS